MRRRFGRERPIELGSSFSEKCPVHARKRFTGDVRVGSLVRLKKSVDRYHVHSQSLAEDPVELDSSDGGELLWREGVGRVLGRVLEVKVISLLQVLELAGDDVWKGEEFGRNCYLKMERRNQEEMINQDSRANVGPASPPGT